MSESENKETCGAASLVDIVIEGKTKNLILNRNPNVLLLSEELANQLIVEMGIEVNEEGELMSIRDLIGSTLLGLKVMVVKNKSYDYIEVLEILTKE